MKRLLYVFASLIILSTLESCENDIEINAPWKETPVVYAFLDPNSSTQYLRIQKTYQNSVDLTTDEGAKINDSLYFDTILVKVKSTNQAVTFIKTTEKPKETGFFSSGTHYLYKGNLQPIPGRTYTLELYSPKTKNTYLSTTTTIGTSDLVAAAFRFPSGNPEATINITVNPIEGASEVGATLRFKYLEYSSSISLADTFFIDYTIDSKPYQSGTDLRYNINNRTYVNYLKDLIAEKTGYTRQIIGFDIFYIGGGKEITDLMEVMKPSAMVVQKKLEYSNISGGLGIFSSRSENIDFDVQNRSGSNWSNPTSGKAGMINLLNGMGESVNPKNLNFAE